MMGFNIRRKGLPTGLWFPGFLVFIAVLWLAGGASRADVLGQAVMRATATIALIAVVLFAERPKEFPERPVLALLLVSLAVVLVQLIPLPAEIWLALPGRSALGPANDGQAIARPLSMVPGATANAAASLLVPLATFFLMLSVDRARFRQIVTVLLVLITISTLQGALQFSGVHFDNPLINDPQIDVVGPFANRNHFALMLALGCLIVPVWAFLPSRPQRWRAAAASMTLPLLLLVALASGSRAGLALCCVGLIVGLTIVSAPLRARFRRKPAWVMPAMIGGAVVLGVGLIAISMASDRAVAINRAFDGNAESDIRFRAMPTVLAMIGNYLPWGSGFGGFDPLFRIHEPFALLKPTYFNHAHNDVLEVALDGGVPALIVLVTAIGWWLIATIRACRASSSSEAMLARLGSAMLALIFMASLVDYPARTPMIMVMIIIAAIWLSNGNRGPQTTALPERDRHL